MNGLAAMLDAVGIFACTFTLVFLTGLQSQNISGKHKRMSFWTSACISAISLITVKVISNPTNLLTDFAYIFGGPFGIVASIKFHPWMKTKLPHLFSKKIGKNART